MAGRTRLTLEMDSELHRKLKQLANLRGVTIREFCLRAIENEMQDESRPYLTAEEAPLLAELWDNDEDAVYDDV